MMDFILDANVIMAILISGKAIYKPLLREYTFISSDFAFIEIEKYQALIKNKTKINKETFNQFSYFIFSHIHFMPAYLVEDDAKRKAINLVNDIDPKDVSYVALSIQIRLYN